MSRNRKRQPLPFWASAKPDGKDERFIQIGNSLLLSEAFQDLSAGAQVTYFGMMMESGGQRRFKFPGESIRKYGLPLRSCRRYIAELLKAGFIVCTYPGRSQLNPNEYEFSLDWKKTSAKMAL